MDWNSATDKQWEQAESATREFLLGSESLDRQKAEIKRVVCGLAGLMDSQGICASFSVRMGDFEWWVHTFKPGDTQIVGRHRTRGVASEVYSSGKPDRLEVLHVGVVRRFLPMLVAEVLEQVEGIKRIAALILFEGYAARTSELPKLTPLGPLPAVDDGR